MYFFFCETGTPSGAGGIIKTAAWYRCCAEIENLAHGGCKGHKKGTNRRARRQKTGTDQYTPAKGQGRTQRGTDLGSKHCKKVLILIWKHRSWIRPMREWDSARQQRQTVQFQVSALAQPYTTEVRLEPARNLIKPLRTNTIISQKCSNRVVVVAGVRIDLHQCLDVA